MNELNISRGLPRLACHALEGGLFQCTPAQQAELEPSCEKLPKLSRAPLRGCHGCQPRCEMSRALNVEFSLSHLFTQRDDFGHQTEQIAFGNRFLQNDKMICLIRYGFLKIDEIAFARGGT
ncbi:hypothetical protein [Bradyrhizobium sp. AZCC 2230]|uniref:hypothetical protein n=1 Tax=Bradyrhizobium sp. AZCC 2230 TaxID=3117021 RepID=UPI002FEF8B64